MTEEDTHPREYPEFPLTAVAGLILDSDQKILLIKRAYPPAKNKWSLPGGVVHLGEDLKEALVREIIEECGIEVKVGSLFNVLSKIIKDKNKRIQYHYIILDYLCQYQSGHIRSDSDAEAAEWFHLKEIGQLNLSEGLLNVIDKGFKYISEGKSTGV